MIKRQAHSFKCAFCGIWYTIRNEAHMRFHIAAAVTVFILAALYGFAPAEWAALIATVCLVIGLELVNTAAERLCNLYTEEFHPLIKIIKDVSAGAVLIAAIGSVGAGFFLFFRPEKISEILSALFSCPLYVAGLAAYVAVMALFVLKFHPRKTKSRVPRHAIREDRLNKK